MNEAGLVAIILVVGMFGLMAIGAWRTVRRDPAGG